LSAEPLSAILAAMRARREAGDFFNKIRLAFGKDQKTVMRMLSREVVT
jgi:hypothetical protein